MNLIKTLFGMKERVTRKTYIFWGTLLMFIKYSFECTLYYLATGKFLTPFNFASPMFTSRYPVPPPDGVMPDWFIPTVVIWSLPFVWIGVGMSVRRAADANLSPWVGSLFFVPGINYLLMFVLSLVPTSASSQWGETQITKKYSNIILSFKFSVLVIVLFTLLGTLLTWFNTHSLQVYTTSLFFGTPVIIGLVQGYLLNSKNQQNLVKTIGLVALTIILIFLCIFGFALEGFLCLMMSFPVCFFLGIMGAVFGMGIAKYHKPGKFSPTALVLILPIMPWAENTVIKTHRDVVLSVIEINATPKEVWPNVVKFSDLPPTTDWLFQLGIAYPVRARIDGQGIGALRHCEFSTGSFVEPITVWDEPNRLAFNVQYQPQPMKELSFYDRVDAPHLNGYFRSVRGEFLLIPLPNGKTRLEGRTWYEMDIQPGWYWQIYSRWFIHKIHHRVLIHIKNLSEKGKNQAVQFK